MPPSGDAQLLRPLLPSADEGNTTSKKDLEEDMTEFPGTDGGQITDEVTGLTAAAEEVVAARPELVWDLVADVTRIGGWSGNASGRPGSESPAGRGPAPGSPATTSSRMASSTR
jgi:hypothetical protein